MNRKFSLTFEKEVKIIEIKSELSFGVLEAKKWIKEKYPSVKQITYMK